MPETKAADTRQRGFRIPCEQDRWLRVHAAEKETTVSAVILEALTEYRAAHEREGGRRE